MGDTKWDCPQSCGGIRQPSFISGLDSAAVWELCLWGLEALVQDQVQLVPLEASQSLAPWTINSSCFRVFL